MNFMYDRYHQSKHIIRNSESKIAHSMVISVVKQLCVTICFILIFMFKTGEVVCADNVNNNVPIVIKEGQKGLKFKIKIQDAACGLWKITDSNGYTIEDYSSAGYPKTQQEYEVPPEYAGIRVYNTMGNYTKVNINTEALGYSYISRPNAVGNWNIVYFGYGPANGTHYNDATNAIKFRVLDTTANNDECTPALFVLSEYTTKNGKAWDTRSSNSNGWSNSNSVKPYLQTDSEGNIFYDCFSDKEKAVIMSTTKTETESIAINNYKTDYYYWARAANLVGEKIFLLSAQELINNRYGFPTGRASSGYLYNVSGENDKRKVTDGSNTSNWWLRSAYSSATYAVVYVNSSGYCDGVTSYDTGVCVRCALNIPLSSILMTSDASTEGVSSSLPTLSSTFCPLPTPTMLPNTPFKLTIVDKDSNFAITENNIIAGRGEKVILHHSNATTSEGYSIKAVIKKTGNNNIMKGYIAQGKINEDTVSFTIPDDVEPGQYKLIVYNEHNGGLRKTNTAGYDILNLTVKKGCPNNVVGTEGVCTIHKAKWNGSSNSDIYIPSTYDYVYFGHLDGAKQYTCPTASPSPAGDSYKSSYIKTEPLKFRVLDTTSNDGSTHALFMLTEYPIGYRRFNSSGNTWSSSEIKDFLNGITSGCVYNDCFDEIERSAIVETTKTTDKSVSSYKACNLSGEKIFLLSANEVTNNTYGFSTSTDSEINRKGDGTHTGDIIQNWWLRSACSGYNSSNSVACVGYSGSCYSGSSDNTGRCVRCALNIPLSSVLMTSDASIEDVSTVSLIKGRPSSDSSEFKLTILDKDSPRASFVATYVSPSPASTSEVNSTANPIVMSHGGEIITIRYEGAITKVKDTLANNEYITAIIRNNDYTATHGNYYGVIKKITKLTDNEGEIKLAIPEGIPQGDYTVMILNEQKNGAYHTNYASKFDIYIRIENTQEDQTKPIVVGKVYRNETNTGFLVQAKDNGILQGVQYGSIPTVVEREGQVEKINFISTSAITQFDVYNEEGLNTRIQSSSCVVDREAPVVIKEEKDFKWKLTMQDEVSGLWKITDSTGNVVIKDYSVDGYPITQEEFIVPWKYDSVRVYDAVNNYTTVYTYAHEVGTLGYSNISKPNAVGNWNRVYFGYGTANSSHFSDAALYFRVLDTTANDDELTPALFMLTEYTTNSTKMWDSRSYASNIWNSSDTVRSYASGNIFNDCFNEQEKEVIMSTTKTEVGGEEWHYCAPDENPRYYYAGATDLKGEKIFLLSAKEIINTRYGFPADRITSTSSSVYDNNDYRKSSNAVDWWLRSASSSGSSVAYVDSSGKCRNGSSYYTPYYVRCALNVPLSSILMTSSATSSGSPNTSSTFSLLPEVTMTPDSPFRLTIADTSSNFAITENSAIAARGGTITLNYTGGGNTYYRAIIKNTNDSGVTSGWVAQASRSGSKLSFTLPSSVPAGRYKMVVYNEYDRGSNQTNYAGYDTLNLTVVESGADTTAPEILNVYKNSEGTYYKITAKDDMGLSYLISDSVKKDISYLNKLGTTNIKVSANDAVNVYDVSDKHTAASDSGTINIDSTPPIYTITYNKGDYTIHVSDTESGIWKITDSTGEKILKDWSR